MLPAGEGILHQPAVQIPNPPPRMSKRILPQELVEIIIDPLPVEGHVVGGEDGPAGAGLRKPGLEIPHDGGRIMERKMAVARVAGYGKRFRQKILRNRPRLPIKRVRQRRLQHHHPKADHGIFPRNRAIRFDIDNEP